MNKTLFQFIKKEDEELLTLGEQIEKNLYNDTHAVLSKSRIFIEKVLTKTFDKEDLNKEIYPALIDKINKLDRTGVLTQDIVERLHWLRKAGNKASHETITPKVEDALKAHRFLFDVAVWYMEVYDGDFESPEYHLPFQAEQSVDTQKINEIVNRAVKNSVSSVVEEKISNLKSTQIKEEQINHDSQKRKISTKHVKSNESDDGIKPLEYFRRKGYEVIDKRSKGGTVWVIGSWDDRSDFFAMKKYKFYFRFSKDGSRSTNNRSAWFMLNKNYMGEMNSEEITVDEQPHNESFNELEPISENETINKDLKDKMNTVFNFVEISSPLKQLSNQIAVPEYLLDIQINQVLNGQLNQFTHLLGLYKFSEINDDELRKLYLNNQDQFFDAVIKLWILGVRFSNNLSKIIDLPESHPINFIQVQGSEEIKLNSVFNVYIANKLSKIGVETVLDLNMIPIDSLKWLLEDHFELFKDIAINQKFVGEYQSDRASENSKNSTSNEKILKLEGQMIKIPDSIAKFKITKERFENSQNVVIQLQKKGFHTFFDLPESLDNFHTQLRNVGPKAIEKFWNSLVEIIQDNTDIKVSEVADKFQGERVKFQKRELILTETMKTGVIEEDRKHYTSIPIIVDKLKNVNIIYYSDLPYDLTEIQKIKGIGYGKVYEFFNALKEVKSEYLEVEKKRREIEGLDEEQLTHYYIEQARKEIESIVSNIDKQKELNLHELSIPILNEKFQGYRQGGHITLQSLGEYYGITRERVRQISNKTLSKLESLNNYWINKILERSYEQQVIKNDFFQVMDFVDFIMTEILAMRELYYNPKYDCITPLKNSDFDKIENDIRLILKKKYRATLFDAKEINETISQYVSGSHLQQIINKIMFQSYIDIIGKYDKYYLLENSKNDLAEIYLKQYPNGLEVYKEVESIATEMNNLFSEQFNPDRATASLFTTNERVYLWGRGRYIHEQYVESNDELLDEIIENAIDIVNDRGILSVTRLYRDYEDRLQELNIPNEYALYTMLRTKEPKELALIKFPKIYQAGAKHKGNSEIIKDFIKAKRKPVSNQEIMEHFTKELGWKKFTVEVSISNDYELISCGRGFLTVVNLDNQLVFMKLNRIHKEIENILCQQNVVHIQKFYSQFESLCQSMSIKTPIHLYNVLRYYFHEKLHYFRYPYITEFGRNFDEMTNVKLIENYILEQMTETSKEEITEWVLNELGGSENTVHNAFYGSQNLLTYTSGKYSEVIHKDIIGWNEQKEASLIYLIEKTTEKYQNDVSRPFINIDDFFYELEKELPELDNDILWTSDLVADILKRSKLHNFIIVGSDYKIVINSNLFTMIDSHTKFIEYLLISPPFNGSAKLTEFKRLLREIGYSYNGEILNEVEVNVNDGNSPITIIGNEIMYDESKVKIQ